MGYQFSDRLQHANDRFAEVNTEPFIYIAGDIQRPIEASPILISGEELIDGDAAITRVERHDFGISISWLKNLYPPQPGHRLRRQKTGEEFILSSMGGNEPPYVHVTSNRSRIIVHTVRSKNPT